MLHNYFIIAWRNILKHKFSSLINIFGLGVGIAFTLLIAVYAWQEATVNSNLKDVSNQYIIQSKWKDPNLGYDLATVAELPRALKEQYPALVSNFYHWDGVTSNVSKGDKHFRESIRPGDSTILKMYGLKLAYGDASTALNDKFSAVITGNTAIKYFGKTDVVGQSLTIENFSGSKHEYMITGVLDKMPKNSITNFNDNNNSAIFLNANAGKFLGRTMDGWTNTFLIGLIELQPGVKPADLDRPMRDLIRKHTATQISANLTPYLVPLSSYHLDTNNGLVRNMLYTLSIIALFILLMAVINFINICIGRSAQRMKEIGIRKVLGGLKQQLIWQFLTESIVMSMIATTIALGLYAAFRPVFGDLLNTELTGLFSFPIYFYVYPIILAVLIGLLSGVYPALVLSSLKSIDSLKGKLSQVKDNVIFRKSLLAFQFGTATIVLIGAIVISKQIDLFFSKSLGYNKDYVVYAQLPRDWSKNGVRKMESNRLQLAQMPQVNSIALSWEIPNGNNGFSWQVYKQGQDSTRASSSQVLVADGQYAETYGIPLRAGSFFRPFYTDADSAKVVINETQARALGYADANDAIGQQIRAQGVSNSLTICGVVNDFQFGSMQQKISPITFINVNWATNYRYFSIKLKPGNVEQSITALQKKWAELMPGAPFEYNFMDQALRDIYKTEIQLKKASYAATTLAMIIVFLGILGLISLSIQKRTKEIGIRKVLGSSVGNVVMLFLSDFLRIILISGTIASPLAYLAVSKWLNSYAYKISITALPFIVSIGILTIITTVLICLQTIKAALANPVKSLRSE
ncbi:MAG TPA: ABC transporter permease [Mucilaginibacter sp.]|jgi:ABC-type antimicrobial peptide transport system permease subunit|nr:ABC transporter permease [Mucilaginibacter sp.]